jgi:ATP-dependent DNA helicase RecG
VPTHAPRPVNEPTPLASSPGLDTPLQFVKGVGPIRARQLSRLGLVSVRDVLLHLPLRHEDRSRLTLLRDLRPDESQTCAGTIVGVSPPPRGRSRAPFRALLRDASGFLSALWFGRPYLDRVLTRGRRVIVHGKVQRTRSGPLEMQVKDYELVDEGEEETLHTGRLVPVYPLTEGLPQRPVRSLVKRLVDAHAAAIPDPLPEAIRERRQLSPLGPALRAGHFPETAEELAPARRRLVYDELFLLQLGLAIRRHREGRRPGLRISPPGALEGRLRASLPYSLTRAQERVWAEIRKDQAEPFPMNRLLQGDVGSGKTIVATLAILTAIEAGFQAALMAPTEILAEQHFRTLSELVAGIGVEVALLTNATRGKTREGLREAAAAGRIGCVVGTHALVQEGVAPGRKRVITVARDESRRARIYGFLRQEIAAGRQVYVVCPLVAESEASDLRAATEMAARLQREIFPALTVGLLHGRMSSPEKERVMQDFRAGCIDLLVSTTVIEVGIDVPNASVMLIEHAERFGLSQLHQLRGRVGRGPWKSWCILMSHGASTEARRRIQAMTETSDGFRIAEVDLSLRGPGDFFGTRQTGLPELRIADLLRDGTVLEEARQDAVGLVARDPHLVRLEHRGLRAALLERWRGKLALASVG